MIVRERYIRQIRPFYESDLIKIITGIRRSGKSVILGQIKEEISKKTDNIIQLNFEDARVSASIRNASQLIEYVEANHKSGKCYLFFDEVQNLDGWQNACKTLRLHNYSLFITGSNSKLLSGEFTKELSGRYVSFRIRPFVYKEVKEYCDELNRQCSTSDYVIWGGFPNRLEFATEDAQNTYFNDLNNTIILNDLINRYNIRKMELFKAIVNFVLRSNSRILSANSIHDYIKSNNIGCSIATVTKYISYLEEAYIIDRIKLYSPKTKNELAYTYKIYDADVALNSMRCFDNRYDIDHNLENVVYNELLYMGYEVFVYKNKGREIDFLAKKDGKQYFVQVAYSIQNEKAYEREMSAFASLDNMNEKIIITTDNFDFSTSTIRHIKLDDFLEMNEL